MEHNKPEIILASTSSIRRRLLEDAGIRFACAAPDVDESAFTHDDPAELASILARAKAKEVAARHPGRIVVGADQVFTLAGRFMPKPRDVDEARAKLALMNGKTHRFHCGLSVLLDDEVLHDGVHTAAVTFHRLSDAEIDAYAATGEGIGCAGAYRLEEGGVRLIESIEGSHFTILGLPMLPLVKLLRELGLAESIYREKTS